MVAFHFEFANQAGWKCDVCRKSGLERKRRCGWLEEQEHSPAGLRHPVWARKQTALDTCPRSYITAESQTLVEEFFVRRRLGSACGDELSARQVEAFVLLESALGAERNDGQQINRTAF
jgi:hypothetical protein